MKTHTSSSPSNRKVSPPLYWNRVCSSVVKLKLRLLPPLSMPELPQPAPSSGKNDKLWKVKSPPDCGASHSSTR